MLCVFFYLCYQVTTLVLHPLATAVFFGLTSVLIQSSSSLGLLLVGVHAVASAGVLLAWFMVSWLDPSEEAPDPAPCLKVRSRRICTSLNKALK